MNFAQSIQFTRLARKVDEEMLKVEFEKLVASISSDINVGINCEFREKLKGLVKSYVSEAYAVCQNKQNLRLHKTLRGLSSNKGGKVCKYDKGNGVVVLRRGVGNFFFDAL